MTSGLILSLMCIFPVAVVAALVAGGWFTREEPDFARMATWFTAVVVVLGLILLWFLNALHLLS